MTNSSNSNLLAPQYFNGLKKKDVDVSSTYYVDLLRAYLNTSKVNRLKFKFSKDKIYSKINTLLLKDFEVHKPDVVWIFKGMEIYPETLKKLKDKGALLINYNLDHPFRFISKGSGNKNVLDSISLYDLHFTYSKSIQKEFQVKYPNLNISYLPFGYPVNIPKVDHVEILKVCFVGYADSQRAKVIKSLANENINIDVYGNKWEKFISSKFKNVSIHRPVFGNDYWATLKKYRVQLNLLRSHNFNSHNMRTFEIPAASGLMLTSSTPEQECFFTPNLEAFFFDNQSDMISKTNNLLSINRESANEIRTLAKKRCIDSDYSYDNRANTALSTIKNLV